VTLEGEDLRRQNEINAKVPEIVDEALNLRREVKALDRQVDTLNKLSDAKDRVIQAEGLRADAERSAHKACQKELRKHKFKSFFGHLNSFFKGAMIGGAACLLLLAAASSN
jgi:uncharacterized coiled-coil DUF342 family protein